jgi:predicted component of type VI protein secretion system
MQRFSNSQRLQGEWAKSMPAQLQAISGGSSILLDKPILLLGRDPECDIQLESPKISRRHCCIAQVGDYLVVRDLGSTNGIRINGVRVVEGHLKGGDELTIGNHRYQVRWDALMPASVPAAPKKAVVPAGHPVDDPTAGVQEDAVLESCEEPVPIAEPAGAPPADVPRSKSPAEIPIPPEEDSSEDSSYTPGPPDDIGSALPDPIDLAPPQQPQPHITPP